MKIHFDHQITDLFIFTHILMIPNHYWHPISYEMKYYIMTFQYGIYEVTYESR